MAKNLSPDRIERVEPVSWWTGMKTPLQLMVKGDGISSYDVSLEPPEGSAGRQCKISIKEVHKADSPDYLFLDVDIDPDAEPGIYWLVFRKQSDIFSFPYEIAGRKPGSAQRGSFTPADMIYLVMPDRFANGDPSNDSSEETSERPDRTAFNGRHGGDIQGMIDHLDYIAGLGATAIWSTPLLLDNEPECSYHGYACADYYRIDPRFGSASLYREFVGKAHSKGLKVIMDIVTNHCGAAHWWMKNLPFRDWVHVFPEYTGTNNCFSANMDPNASRYDLNIQESGWFVPSMPDMNLDNPFVLKYFIQFAVWWAEYAGLDGFRVDTYPYNEKIPMSRWCASVLEEYPSFNIVGECWTTSIPQLAYWQGGCGNRDGFDSHLPSVMDFPLQSAFCTGVPCDSRAWGSGMARIYECLSHDFVYKDVCGLLIFAGNHDTDRIGDVVRRNPDRYRILMAMLATMRGIPQLLYGDEMMFVSRDRSKGHGGIRVDFPGGWQGDDVDLFTPEGRERADANTDGSPVPAGQMACLYDYTSRLFRWRKEKKVIHSGKTLHFLSRDNTYAYFRYDDTDAVFVFINNSRGRRRIPWSHYSEITAGLHDGRDVITGEPASVTDDTVVSPRQALIIEFLRQ